MYSFVRQLLHCCTETRAVKNIQKCDFDSRPTDTYPEEDTNLWYHMKV